MTAAQRVLRTRAVQRQAQRAPLDRPCTLSRAEWSVLTYIFQSRLINLSLVYSYGPLPMWEIRNQWTYARAEAHRFMVRKGYK